MLEIVDGNALAAHDLVRGGGGGIKARMRNAQMIWREGGMVRDNGAELQGVGNFELQQY